MRLVELLKKKCVFDCIYSPFTKSHIFCLFGAVSHNYLRCCLPGCNPYFTPNINLTHISYIVHRSKSHKLFIFVFLIHNSKKKKKRKLVCIFNIIPPRYRCLLTYYFTDVNILLYLYDLCCL